jgi:hypothetical protein
LLFLCSLSNLFHSRIHHEAGTGSASDTFTGMERFFLALIVSGLLLAVAAASLFVATGADDRTTSVVNLPAAPSTFVQKLKRHEAQEREDHR